MSKRQLYADYRTGSRASDAAIYVRTVEPDAAIYGIVINTREKRDEKSEFLYESDLLTAGDPGCTFYNSSMKAQANEKEIAALTDKVDTLQEQQNELLSALETSYVNRMQNQAASAESGSSDADAAGDDKTTDTSDGNVSDADAEDTATADSDNVYKDGTYTGEAEGYGGTIQVEVTLAGDEITSINVVSAPGEDSAYLSQAESVIDSILSAQSTDVDTVSGATFSSTGILNAVDAALGKAENS